MGMAASQARFLGLTARKTNVEFEGQQINQQRTCLANQSANYYNDMLGMSVPTPPSVDNFTKTTYSFNDGAITNTITALMADKQNPGMYKVSYLSTWEDDFTPVAAASSMVTVNGTNYQIGGTTLRQLGNVDNNAGNDEYLNTLSTDQLTKLRTEEAYYNTLLNEKYKTTGTWYVRYVQNSSTGQYQPYFYKPSDLTNTANRVTNEKGDIISQVDCYTIGSATTTNEIKGVDAKVEKDSTGRYIAISLKDANGNYTTYSLATSTVTDQDAYDDAMNQYEYDKAKYDQTIEEINAKIQIIQAQDKNLELRLKQLDTEQDAISIEMDAVQKVIEKNTESTFKTFG